MEIDRALTFVFRDPAWGRKLLVLALCSVLPAAAGLLAALAAGDSRPTGDPLLDLSLSFAPGFATIPVYGFVLRITRGVLAGLDSPLPAWTEPRALLWDGTRLWGVTAVWGLPLTLAGLTPGGGGDPAAGSSQGVVCLGLAAGLLLALVSPAAEARLAATDSFRAGLDAAAAFGAVRRNPGDYGVILLLFAVGYGVAFGLASGGAWLALQLAGGGSGALDAPDLGTALATVLFLPYFSCVIYHLYGQAYERAHGAPIAPPDAGFGRPN